MHRLAHRRSPLRRDAAGGMACRAEAAEGSRLADPVLLPAASSGSASSPSTSRAGTPRSPPAPWAGNGFLADRTVWAGIPSQTPAGGYPADPARRRLRARGAYPPPAGYQPPPPPAGYEPPPATPRRRGYAPPPRRPRRAAPPAAAPRRTAAGSARAAGRAARRAAAPDAAPPHRAAARRAGAAQP